MISPSRRDLSVAAVVVAAFCLLVGAWLFRIGPELPISRRAADSSLVPPGSPPETPGAKDRADRKAAGETPPSGAAGPGLADAEDRAVPSGAAGESALSSPTLSGEGETTGTHVLKVQTVWRANQSPAADTLVHLYCGHKERGERRSVWTDRTGSGAILYPAEWTDGRLAVERARASYEGQIIPLPSSETYVLELERAFSAYGTVFVREGDSAPRPAAGARVTVFCKDPPQTVSAPDGSWRLDSIPAREAAFFASHEDLCSAEPGEKPTPVVLTMDADNGPFDLYLEHAGGTLTGAVLKAEDRSPIADATVEVLNFPFATATDEKGAFILQPLPWGEHELSASAKGYANQRFRVQLAPGKEATTVILMRPGGAIHVLGLDRDGRPVEGAGLGVITPEKSFAYTKTNAEGRVAIDGRRMDIPYTVFLRRYNKNSNSETVVFKPGETEVHVTLRFDFRLADEDGPGRRGVFVGRVVDEAGWPVRGATVLFRWRYHVWRGQREGENRDLTGDDGRYRVEIDNVNENGYEAAVFAEGYGTQWKDTGKPGTAEKPTTIDFALRPERTVRGTVVDPEDRPLAGVKVEAWPAEGYEQFFPGQPLTETRADGTFWIRGLDGDSVRMQASKEGYEAIVNRLVPTDQETRIIMRRPGQIRGRVVDATTQAPIPNFGVRVRGSGLDPGFWTSPHRFYDEEGRFAIDGAVETKTYTVEVESELYGSVRRENVAAGAAGRVEEYVFALAREKKIEGIVVDAATGAPIPNAVVVSVGGSSVDWEHLAWLPDARQTTTGADGQFSVGLVASNASAVLVCARADSYAPGAVRWSEGIEADLPKGEVLRIPLGRGAALTCSLFASGQPQSDRTVRLSSRNDETGVDQSLGAKKADASGTVVWEHVPAGWATVASYASLREGGPSDSVATTIRLNEGDSKRIDFGDAPGLGTLYGLVRLDGAPRPDLVIAFQSVSISGGGSRSGLTVSDAEGNYRLSGFLPGTYNMSVTGFVGGSDGPRREAAYEVRNNPVTVSAGEQRHDIDVSLAPSASPVPRAP